MASLPCAKCNSSDAVEAYSDGDFCFSCHSKINSRRLTLESDETKQKNPKKIQLTSITDYWIHWLKERGINDKTIRQFDIQYDELSKSIAYPVKIKKEIVGYQLRDENKKIKTARYAKEDEPFLFEACANNTEIVVVVEDPVSAMRIWQDVQVNAIALLGTHLNAVNKLYLINKYKHFVVWMDGDLPGYKAAQKISTDLLAFCAVNLIFTRQDPKEFEARSLKEFLIQG
jgi:5S rRNA maturation endonuclease (ribonuclease M5)